MGKPTTPTQTASADISGPPSPPEDDIVHIIGYDMVTRRDDEIETLARSTLISTLESAEYGAAGDDNVYGNPLGLDMLSDRHDSRQRLASLEDWKVEAKIEIAKLRQNLDDQRRDIEALKLASEGYRKIRNRFLDVYRRDVIHDLDYQGRHNIAEGNEAAYYGDAVADAALYISGERLDHGILLEIYGIGPIHIASLAKAGHYETIKVLNTGATWRANQSTTAVPPDVEAAFATFVKELGRSQSLCEKSLTDGTTRLSKAYYAFWAAHKAH